MQLLITYQLQLIFLQLKGLTEDGNEVERHASDEEPFAALAFKIMTDPFVGRLTFFRVYSGTVESGFVRIKLNKR